MTHTIEKHFVTFYSPGTFVPECTTRPIDKWDPLLALEMSRAIKERYDARPYAFQFSTRARGPDDLDSHETNRSPRYFINGKIETREEVEARNDPREEILRDNLRINGIARVVVTCSPWKNTAELLDGDVVLNEHGEPVS